MSTAPDQPDTLPPVVLSDHDAVFTIMRLLQRRPWGKPQSAAVDRVAHQVVAEAITAALRAEGIGLARAVLPARNTSPWPVWPQDDAPPEHPAD